MDATHDALLADNRQQPQIWSKALLVAALFMTFCGGFTGGMMVNNAMLTTHTQMQLASLPEVKWEAVDMAATHERPASAESTAFDDLAGGLEPEPKVCVVVGAGPGMGEHLARRFAAGGCRVALLARNIEAIQQMAAEIPGSKAYACDAFDEEQVKSTFASIRGDLGEVDALLYNVGIGKWVSFDDLQSWQLELNTKVPLGLMLTAKQVTPSMVARGRGAIGVTGATAALRAVKITAGFAPGCFAMRALAQSMARDLGPKGVHVFQVVVDGSIYSESKDNGDTMGSRSLHPKDIAETYHYLVRQPRSAWTAELSVDAWGAMSDMQAL